MTHSRTGRRPAVRLAWLAGALAALAALAIGPRAQAQGDRVAPDPATPIKHLVVLMQAGHSFDNYFGTYPGADGIPADACVPVDPGTPGKNSCLRPFPIGERSTERISHNAALFQAQYNGGRMNGFIAALQRRNQDGTLAIGHYDERSLPYYWNVADEYVLFDRFFSSAAAGELPNRMFWVSGAPGSADDRIPAGGFGDLPTIFDALERRGVSWKFYVEGYNPQLNFRAPLSDGKLSPQVTRAPLLAFARFIDQPELAARIVDLDQYYEDLRAGMLPAVAYVATTNTSERPPSRPDAGQRLARGMINALMQSDAWGSSAMLITYDTWGGWYDHVPPPQVDQHGYGFRVPALLVSPYARRGYVDSTTLDFAAILKFIEHNYGLEPLTARDAQAGSMLGAFDFAAAPRPPRFLSFERGVTKPAEPRRELIYIFYSMAIVLAGLILAGCAAVARSGQPGRPAAQERAS